MLRPRMSFFLTCHEGKLWAIGGTEYPNVKILSAEIYDPALNKWKLTELPSGLPLESFRGGLIGCTYTTYFNPN